MAINLHSIICIAYIHSRFGSIIFFDFIFLILPFGKINVFLDKWEKHVELTGFKRKVASGSMINMEYFIINIMNAKLINRYLFHRGNSIQNSLCTLDINIQYKSRNFLIRLENDWLNFITIRFRENFIGEIDKEDLKFRITENGSILQIYMFHFL